MSARRHTHDHCLDPSRDVAAYRRALLAVLALNAAMFGLATAAGFAAASASLQADALDFLGDSAGYAISLVVAGMPLRHRALAALARAATMGLFGLWVIATAIWQTRSGALPHAVTIGAVGLLALAVNAGSFGLLWVFRAGDANMRSAWLCKRNDVVGNVAIVLAALGVFGTGAAWPDLVVAAVIVALALQGAADLFRQSIAELRAAPVTAAAQ